MGLDWKAFVNFGGKDEISGVVDNARKSTEKASKGMGDSLSETGKKADTLKEKIGGIGDIAKGVALGNLISKGIESAISGANNRELIKEKIHEYVQKAVVVFKKAVSIIQELIGRVQKVIQFFKEWGPIILAVGAAVGILSGIASAVIAIKNAITMVKSAFANLNAVMAANPVGVIVIADAAAIAGFVLLTKKIGGVVPALEVVGQTIIKVVLTPFNLVLDAIQLLLPMGARIGVVLSESFTAIGQTIMKCLLTPINLAIDGIKGVLNIASKLPGIGNMAKGALEAVDSFQNKMNIALTGSASTLMNSGADALLDPARNAGATMADKIAAAGIIENFTSRKPGFVRSSFRVQKATAGSMEAIAGSIALGNSTGFVEILGEIDVRERVPTLFARGGSAANTMPKQNRLLPGANFPDATVKKDIQVSRRSVQCGRMLLRILSTGFPKRIRNCLNRYRKLQLNARRKFLSPTDFRPSDNTKAARRVFFRAFLPAGAQPDRPRRHRGAAADRRQGVDLHVLCYARRAGAFRLLRRVVICHN